MQTHGRTERATQTGRHTVAAEELLGVVARYIRLFHILFYASVTTRFAALRTPQGLSALVDAGALTPEEREGLLRVREALETSLA